MIVTALTLQLSPAEVAIRRLIKRLTKCQLFLVGGRSLVPRAIEIAI